MAKHIRCMVLIAGLAALTTTAVAQQVINVTPDLNKGFPAALPIAGLVPGSLTYGEGPGVSYSPSAIDAVGNKLLVVNGFAFKELEFDDQWNLVKETIPKKLVQQGYDYQFHRLYDDGVCFVEGVYDNSLFLLTPDGDKVPATSPPTNRISATWGADYLSSFPIGTDTLYIYKGPRLAILTKDGTWISDKTAVRKILLDRMEKRTFLKDDTQLAEYLVDLNWKIVALVTDRDCDFGQSDRDPSETAAFSDFLKEVFRHLPAYDLKAFLKRINGKLALVKITDTGFILENLSGRRGSNDVSYVNINMLNHSVALMNFSVPDGLIWILPVAFSDNGKYLFEAALTGDRRGWHLLRYSIPN